MVLSVNGYFTKAPVNGQRFLNGGQTSMFRNIEWGVFISLLVIGGLWVITFFVSHTMFFHSDIIEGIHGTISLDQTDVKHQCGLFETDTDIFVSYKLNHAGKITYLCPIRFWPIQKQVEARALKLEFKKTLSSGQLEQLQY